MSIFFLDTSALVKRYITEPGSPWIMAQCHPKTGNTLFISQATLVEAVAAFCRRSRATNSASWITSEERDKQILVFRQDLYDQYKTVKVKETTYERAGNLCRIHQLRAYDAIQLTCALVANQKLKARNQPSLIFLSSDNKLLEIARAEGFQTDNPNNHL